MNGRQRFLVAVICVAVIAFGGCAGSDRTSDTEPKGPTNQREAGDPFGNQPETNAASEPKPSPREEDGTPDIDDVRLLIDAIHHLRSVKNGWSELFRNPKTGNKVGGLARYDALPGAEELLVLNLPAWLTMEAPGWLARQTTIATSDSDLAKAIVTNLPEKVRPSSYLYISSFYFVDGYWDVYVSIVSVLPMPGGSEFKHSASSLRFRFRKVGDRFDYLFGAISMR